MQIISSDGTPAGYGSATLVSGEDDAGTALTVTNNSADPTADWDLRYNGSTYTLFYTPDPTDEVYLKEPDPRNFTFDFEVVGTSTYTPSYTGALLNVAPFFNNPNRTFASISLAGDPFWYVGETGNPNNLGLGGEFNPFIIDRNNGLQNAPYVTVAEVLRWVFASSLSPVPPPYQNGDPLTTTPDSHMFNGSGNGLLASNMSSGQSQVWVFPDGNVQSQNALILGPAPIPERNLLLALGSAGGALGDVVLYPSAPNPASKFILKIRVEDCVSAGSTAFGPYQPTPSVGAKFTYYSTWVQIA